MTGEAPEPSQHARSNPGFGGEVARLYEKYRRGYPPAVVDAIVDAFDLSSEDTVVDLGCGTGQLTLALAERVRDVVGVDPEPDMLWLARGHDEAAKNITWMLGSDEDMTEVAARLGTRPVGAVTVATALHWMDETAVFSTAYGLVRPGGGCAVVTNGKALWHQDAPWSRALREFLERWTGRPATQGCGTDEETQARYREGLADAGFMVSETHVRYTDLLDLDRLVGAVLSAFSTAMLPRGDDRVRFRDGVRETVGDGPYREAVDVRLLFGARR